MRRIIKNSTAIAAGLTLLLPQIASSENRVPDAQAEAQGPARAEAMPDMARVLAQEIANGLTVDGLICANGDARPCLDSVRLLTPAGVTVRVSESGSLILAPQEVQVNGLNADGQMAVIPGNERAKGNPVLAASTAPEAEPEIAEEAAAPAAAEPAAEPEAEMAEAQAEAPANTAEPAAEPETMAEDDLAQALADEVADDQAADQAVADTAETKAQPEAKPEKQAAAEEPAPEPAAEPAAQAEQPEQASEQPVDELAKALEEQAGLVDPAQQADLVLSETERSAELMEAMPGLANVLRREVGGGLIPADLICQDGEAQPCTEGVALMTPSGVAVQVNDGVVQILPGGRQANRVQDGVVVPRAPEANTVETAAAREAATEVDAPAAAALQAAEGAGEVVAQQEVTETNTRSSAQDFEASLRDALEGVVTMQNGSAAQANTAATDGDDDNDLAKALILGLGAVAVGQMLNNDRQVALSAPDRVVVQREDGSQEVIKDEVALLRQPGSTVATEGFDDGSSRTIVTRADGSRVVTIRDADLRVLRRTLISADGKSTMLIDDTADVQPVDVTTLPEPAPIQTTTGTMTEDQLREALQRESQIDRRFTLGQIRNIPEVRALVAPVNIDAITFDTGSAAINPDQAQQLASLGRVIQDAIARNPQEIFMIEGHTDTVGSDAMNLALSDRRAESVALALSEYFSVPPENIIVQGYGEQFLKIRSEGDIRANRRASVRRITELLQTASN